MIEDFAPVALAPMEPSTPPPRDAAEPANDYQPPGEPMRPPALFELVHFDAIRMGGGAAWAVKGLLPAEGLAVAYGAPGSRKSFVALDLCLAIAEGRSWGERRVKQGATVYVAAEGAGGFAKRIAAYLAEHDGVDVPRPFYLIAAAPRLGCERDDVDRLIASVEAAAIAEPLRMIVVDTLAQSLAGGDENGEGMVTLITNAQRLASRFRCVVALIHHAGKDAERGMRGHSSLLGAADFVLKVVASTEERGVSVLTAEKVKDGEAGLTFLARTKSVAIGEDEDGEEISSLVVEAIEPQDAPAPKARRERPIPQTARLFMAALQLALADFGEKVQPFPDGPFVHAVDAEKVRAAFYASRPAESVEANRKAFNRCMDGLIDRQVIVGRKIGAFNFLWTA